MKGKTSQVQEATGMPLLGDRFPQMEVQTTHGVMRLPEAFSGKWFLFFSHPADFTPVCTTEFVAFQKRYEKFKELGVELIGLSIDRELGARRMETSPKGEET